MISTLYYRFISPNIIKRFKDCNNIYLTFDDGPDPIYTNELLDILKKYDVKASFFLVAKKAFENRDIVYRIIKEGHSIGLHSYDHRNPLLFTPRKLKKDFKDSLDIMKTFDLDIVYYRPPWGIFNIFTHHYAKANNLKTILWSLSSKDWKVKTPVDYIVRNITENVKPGDILLLHDSNGDKYAPRNTLNALDILIPILLNKGFQLDKIN